MSTDSQNDRPSPAAPAHNRQASDTGPPPPPTWVKLALASIGVLLALVVGEVGARVLETQGYNDAIRDFSRTMVETDPVLGHRLVPNQRVTVDGIAYRTSSLGQRGPELRDGGAPRVLVLGDSVTMGWGVAEEATWPSVLSETLHATRPGVEVVNGGVLGWGVEQYAQRLPRLAELTSPDVILVGYFPNDPGGTESVSRGRRSSSALGRLVQSRLGGGNGQTASEYHRSLHAEGSPGWTRVRDSFASIADSCRERAVPCAIVLLPSLSEQPYPLSEEHARLVALASEVGLLAIDLAPTVADREPPSMWVAPDDAHPNAAIHRVFGLATADWLENVIWQPERAE